MKNLLALALSLATTLAAGPAERAAAAPLPSPVVDTDYYQDGSPAEAKVELGRLLFFDKVLSGNRNISCATCHHPAHGSSDALPLGLGEGARGLGPRRQPGESPEEAVHERVPRNSPALFNLGAREFSRLFHDGRVEADPKGFYEGGFITPAKWKLPRGLDNVLAAQAMFPVTSATEMAGQKGENGIADAQSLNNAAGAGGIWEQIARRLQQIPEYVELFRQAFPGQIEKPQDLRFVHAANAIAAFETREFRADQSPFDEYLRGSENSLSEEARRGLELFYGKAGCSGCHSGKFQTDHGFHAIAMPQIGPGKGDGRDGSYWRSTGLQAFPEDFGRGRVTVRREDLYKFRTPSLRNVALTGPWGHDGAFETLEGVVRHHLDPVRSLEAYAAPPPSLPQLEAVLELTAVGSRIRSTWLNEARMGDFLRRDTWVQENAALRRRIAEANELDPVELADDEVDDLLAFLHSLTDPGSAELGHLIPERVPSGLPVED